MNKILKHLTAIVLLLTLGTTAVLAQDPEQEEDILKQAKQQYTLYRNYFKQKQYAEAYPYWQFVVEKRPMLNENLYVNGPVLLYDLIKKTQDPAQKQRLIDTLMLQYDLRLKYFGKGKEGLIYGKKAIEISSRYPSKEYPDSVKSAMELYNKALDFDGANTNMGLDTKVELKNIDCRVLNGRKVNIKATLDLNNLPPVIGNKKKIKLVNVPEDEY